MLIVIGGAFYVLGPGKSEKSSGSGASGASGADEKGWTSGDVRTVSHNAVCQPIAGIAAQLVPRPDPQGPPSTRTDAATCHWRNLNDGRKHSRSISVTVVPHSPSLGPGRDQTAVEVASSAFQDSVRQYKAGPLGERVKGARSVPALGDEAAIVYGVGTTDSGAAHLVIRRRNVAITITYQGSDNSLRGNPTEGYYPVIRPLSQRAAEQGALAIGRRLVATFA
ncbi:MAG TPA: hypothetical protein VFU43_07870 [Streptosporangiaceae bacterium]|nr:hypothetical protein [Streptosporangiaceae bacterium]